MNAYWNENAGRFVGRVLSEPVFSHENHGSRFYRLELQVPRLSGQADVLPVLLPEALRHMTGRLLKFSLYASESRKHLNRFPCRTPKSSGTLNSVRFLLCSGRTTLKS